MDTREIQSQTFRLRSSWDYPIYWLSHLDRMRIMERLLLRTQLPLVYSQGYNPRPQFVFALPTPSGVKSHAEYIDFNVAGFFTIDEIRKKVEAEVIEGLSLLSIKELKDNVAKNAMSQVRLADYVFEAKDISQAMETLLSNEEIIVQKFSKKKYKDEDIKALVYSSKRIHEDQYFLRVHAGSKKNLRADLFIQALEANSYTLAKDLSITKEELWLKEDKSSSVLRKGIDCENPFDDTKEIIWDAE